jgi:hypothetical protein
MNIISEKNGFVENLCSSRFSTFFLQNHFISFSTRSILRKHKEKHNLLIVQLSPEAISY